MEVMIETCCSIDVHQKSIVCCSLDGPLDTNKPKKIQKTFGTTTTAIQNALAWLEESQVTHVFFESTGQYWVPLFNIFSDSTLTLVLANPQHIKNVPGRKTDVKDAKWLAQLGRCGLIEPSYIPEPEVMMPLRLLTRHRQSYKQRQTQVKNESHNLLQRANIKLTSFLSDIFSKTGQALLRLVINGETITVDNIASCLAELGPNVDVFKSDGHLASWAGLCPGSYESAGKKKSSHITKGDRYIKQALILAGLTAGRSKDTAFLSFYNRISQRGSKTKDVIACAHNILKIIYKLLTTLQPYQNPICKIKLDRKKPSMLGSDKHHICLKGTNINDLYSSYHK
ncbi:transposase [Streptococcus jiangjianxini]|uniref:transposase n=1 Tax=Streptococcus jiangjianxini TaxID=3161189 RepID=UPI0032EB4512